jgi:hypothetical protein
MAKLFQGKIKFVYNKKKRIFGFSVSVSMLWGNLYYVYMARKLAYKENRGDVCTMPYGINTPGACKIISFFLEKSNFYSFIFSCVYF